MLSVQQSLTGFWADRMVLRVPSTAGARWLMPGSQLSGAQRCSRDGLCSGIAQAPAAYGWAVLLLFRDYSKAEGWLCCLGSLSITLSFALILCAAGTVSVCGRIHSLLSTAPHQRTRSGSVQLFHIVVSWKICKCPVIFYGFISCTKCPAGSLMSSRHSVRVRFFSLAVWQTLNILS